MSEKTDVELTVSSTGQLELEDPIMEYFEYGHLPPHLWAFSKPWCDLAQHVVATTPRSAERTVALRKLLEGKDAAVRAAMPRRKQA